MLKACIFICLVLFTLGGHSRPLESSLELLKAPKTAIKDVEFLDDFKNNEHVKKAIDAKNLLVVADWHGTVLDTANKDYEVLEQFLKKVSEKVHTVILSRGPSKDLKARHFPSPDIILASDQGMKIMKNGKPIFEENKEYLEDIKVIRGFYLDVIKEVAEKRKEPQYANVGLWEVENPEYTFLFGFKDKDLPPEAKVSDEFVKAFFSALKKKLEDPQLEGEQAKFNSRLNRWEVIRKGKSFDIQLRGQEGGKGDFVTKYIDESKNSEEPFDYVISIGDGEADEPMFEAVNSKNFLSIVVENAKVGSHRATDPNRETAAKLRIKGVPKVRELLNYITERRPKPNPAKVPA